MRRAPFDSLRSLRTAGVERGFVGVGRGVLLLRRVGLEEPVLLAEAARAIRIPAVLDGGFLVRVGDVGDDFGDELERVENAEVGGVARPFDSLRSLRAEWIVSDL